MRRKLKKMTAPLTAGALAHAAGITRETVWRYADRGLLRCVRDHNNWRRFPPSAVFELRRLLGFEVLRGENGEALEDEPRSEGVASREPRADGC